MDDTRDRILQIATTEFLKDGYSRVKTEDLANLLGISKRTLYKHFPSKKSLFSEIVRNGLKAEKANTQAIFDRISSDKSADFIDEIRNIWESMVKSRIHISRVFFDDIRKFTPDIWEEIQEFNGNAMKNNFEVVFNAGIEQGIFRKDINKELIFMIHYHTFQGILTSDITKKMSISIQELVTQFIEIIFLGVMNDDARKKFIDKFSDYEELTSQINNNQSI